MSAHDLAAEGGDTAEGPRQNRAHGGESVTRTVGFVVAIIAYLWFVADIGWAVGFLADLPLATGIDHGPQAPVGPAVVVDIGVLGLFAIHHSVMARESAKRMVTSILPSALERSAYVLVADALLALVLWQWRPVADAVWEVTAAPWRAVLWVGYGLGWAVAVASTFMIDHADLLGLRQAASRPGRYRQPTFRERWFYAWVRHPLMLGLLMAVWITPEMTVGHLLFAGASTAYILVGVRLEERDLRRHHIEYAAYAARVPSLVPRPRRVRGCPVPHGRDG